MHWLDELEQLENRKRRSPSGSARVQDKIFRIQQNYEKNREIYDGFIMRLHNLVERVNTLPMDYREEFGKISSKEKQSHLNNHLHYFSSSRRTQKVEFKSLLKPFKSVHYRHIRIIYFNVAKLMDKVEIEIHEELLEKKRRDGQVIPEHESPHAFKKPQSDKDKFHEIYYYDMEKLTDELALQILDWLAFKHEVSHIPVIAEGELRFKEQ